jgi:hypothetical protein
LIRRSNPILHNETLHQQRSTLRLPIRERWLVVGLLVIVALLMLIPDEGVLDYPIALWALWIFHALVALRLIMAGLNTISREHTAQTWEALILTGVSARQIFMGKWRAVLWRMRGWPILFALVWFAIAILFTVRYPSDEPLTHTQALLFFIGMLSIPVLSVLETLCCTALGIMASAVTRRYAAAAIVASVIRFAPVALFFIPAYASRFSSTPDYPFMFFGLADGGTVPTLLLIIPSPDDWIFRNGVLSLVVAVGLLVALLIASVIISLMAIRRSGALRHSYGSNVTLTTG